MRASTRSIVAAVLCAASLAAGAAEPVEPAELARPGRVLMLRHAYAPGTGDPEHFRLGDCSTQRNLDARGRAQARAIGERLRSAGVRQARLYSSQWCRCMDTARLLGLGPVEAAPVLNSFFGQPGLREARIAALRGFLAGLPVDGPPVVLVTHQVAITGITGGWVDSGGGVVLELNGTGHPRVVGDALVQPAATR